MYSLKPVQQRQQIDTSDPARRGSTHGAAAVERRAAAVDPATEGGMTRETAIRCEKPQGVVMQPGRMHAGDKVVTMFRAPESGKEYMRIVGPDGREDWFRVTKVNLVTAA